MLRALGIALCLAMPLLAEDVGVFVFSREQGDRIVTGGEPRRVEVAGVDKDQSLRPIRN